MQRTRSNLKQAQQHHKQGASAHTSSKQEAHVRLSNKYGSASSKTNTSNKGHLHTCAKKGATRAKQAARSKPPLSEHLHACKGWGIKAKGEQNVHPMGTNPSGLRLSKCMPAHRIRINVKQAHHSKQGGRAHLFIYCCLCIQWLLDSAFYFVVAPLLLLLLLLIKL